MLLTLTSTLFSLIGSNWIWLDRSDFIIHLAVIFLLCSGMNLLAWSHLFFHIIRIELFLKTAVYLKL